MPITRRTLFTAGASTAAVGLTTLAASPADAAGLPDEINLPNGLRPEGITSGPATRFYVGSVSNGRIVTGDLRRGNVRLLLKGAVGRSLRGLFWDERTGLVWAAGSLGTTGHVWAIDGATGAVVSDTVIPGAVFLNDLVAAGRGVWVTDSNVDRIAVVPTTAGGLPAGRKPRFVALSGDWPAGDGAAINANGISTLRDGSIILNNSRVGGLWNVDPATGATVEIPVSGGPGIVSGDGLERHGSIYYNVRGQGGNDVSAVKLTRSGGEWEATWLATLTAPTLDVPSTATYAAGQVWAVNARFGVPDPDTAPYSITRLPGAGL